MKISELQKRVADVLGVSISQKELSFDIFIETISEILDHGITLKVPRIGFFQLKHNTPKDESEKILFSPLPEDYSQDMRNLYLTIDIATKLKNTLEFDSHVFSIGVGKPLLPLTQDELPDTETSYAMLKKSIEERVRELISESDQIPNFNIWDDYYKSPEAFEERTFNETQSRFNDLTSDLEFKEITVPQNIHPGFFEDYLTSKDSSDVPVVDNDSAKLLKDGITVNSEEKFEDNNWPKIDEKELIDFDKIHNTIEKEIDELNNQEPPVSTDKKQQPSIEKNTDEEDVDYSNVETGTIDDNKNSSLTLAYLLDDIPQNGQLQNLEKKKADFPEKNIQRSAIEEDFSNSKSNPIDQLEENEKKDAKEKPESVDNVGPEIKSVETEKVAESKAEVDLNKPDKINRKNEIEKSENKDKTEIKDNKGKLPESDEIGEHNTGYKFAELEKIIEEGKAESFLVDTSEEKRITKEGNILNNDSLLEDDTFEQNEERIEWNWGDELREEFGITKEYYEDQKIENVPEYDNLDNDLELIDEPMESDRRFTRDLFKELEKTLERDKLFDDTPPRKRPTIVEYPKDTDRSKKVFLEFSGPPTRYEFIEDRRVEREKRMAISLVEEDSKHFVPTAENQQILEKKSDEKEKYFGKTFLIIISTFIIVIVTIIFLVLRPNNKEIQQGAPAISQQNAPNEVQDSQADQNTVSRTQTKIESGSQQKNVSTTPVNDELSDFPISATPPVPIKNGPGDNSISVNKNLKQPANKQVPASTNSGSKSNLNETRIGKSIYTDGKSFNYQTSSWKNKQKAEQEVKRLRSMGLSANVLEVYLPQKGGTWYRVRVGSFKSQKEAENSMKQNNF